jgi:LysM repeat protein
MEFWLKKDEKHKFRLPVNPSDFSMSVTNNNTVVNIHSLGDINLIGKSGLAECSLTSFFPSREYNFSHNSDLKDDPYDYIDTIESWRKDGDPIRLIITSTSVNISVTIESLSYGEQDSTGDVYYTIALKEHRKIKTKSTKKKKGSTTSSKRSTKSTNSNKGKKYTVKKGDTLWKLSKKFYGDGSKYNKIYEANKKVIKNPNSLVAKTVLMIT